VPKSVVELFETLNPRATALLSLVDSSHIEKRTSSCGEEVYFHTARKTPFPLHDLKGALSEAKAWKIALPIINCETIVLFGIGSGWHILPLLSWLEGKDSRRLIVLEDDLPLLALFLESELAKKIVSHPQILILFYEDGEEGDKLFEKLAWALYQQKFIWAALPSYQTFRPKRTASLKQKLMICITEVAAVLDEYFAYGVPCFINFWRNIRFWLQAKSGNGLFNQFRGTTAIVVGAGPSIEKELELIRSLTDKALILAGGSSLAILSQLGIEPHLCAGVDPNPPQIMRLRQSQTTIRPFVFSSRINSDALEQVLGQLLYVRGGEGYGLSRSLERASGISGKVIDGGHSVTNLLVELAYVLGCRKIVLVGMDLAYTNKVLYPKQVEGALDSDESSSIAEHDPRYFYAPGTSGEPVLTESKWITEGKWLTLYQKKHPRLKLINATLSGLLLEEIAVQPLQDACSDLAPQDLYGKVDCAVANSSPLLKDSKRLLRAINRYKNSLYGIGSYIESMQKVLLRISKIQELDENVEWQEVAAPFHEELFYTSLASDFDKMITKWSRAKEFLMLGHHVTDENKYIFRHRDEFMRLDFFSKLAQTQRVLLEGAVYEWMLREIPLEGLGYFPKEKA